MPESPVLGSLSSAYNHSLSLAFSPCLTITFISSICVGGRSCTVCVCGVHGCVAVRGGEQVASALSLVVLLTAQVLRLGEGVPYPLSRLTLNLYFISLPLLEQAGLDFTDTYLNIPPGPVFCTSRGSLLDQCVCLGRVALRQGDGTVCKCT